MIKNKAFDHSKYQNWIDPNETIPYEKNAKEHTEKQVKNIANSIMRFGWQQDVVITSDNILIIGHGRRLAALSIGCEIPYHVVDKKADELTDKDIRELRIADNQTNAETGIDLDILESEIDDLDFNGFDFDFGFDDEEKIEIKEVPVPDNVDPFVKQGDLWLLGSHKLLCGDCLNINLVDNLMNGELCDLVVTDPPYNMNYRGAGNTRNRASKRIMNDKMSEADFEKFLHDVYAQYFVNMNDGASIYVFYKELGSGVFMRQMKEAGLTYKQELIWVKDRLVLGGSKYQSMYEPCLLGCKGKSIKKWNGGRNKRSVIESVDFMTEDEVRETLKTLLSEQDSDVIREKKRTVNDLHPTMKPVRLLSKFIVNSSDENDLVLDFFGGSGSTLMACEQLKRRCYVCELDPKYASVIVQRYIDFKGSDEDVFLVKDGEKIPFSEV